jgi:hypothetical protein
MEGRSRGSRILDWSLGLQGEAKLFGRAKSPGSCWRKKGSTDAGEISILPDSGRAVTVMKADNFNGVSWLEFESA